MKDIKGYEGLYAVDEEGNVFSLRTHKKKILKASDNGQGYKRVQLCVNKKMKPFYVHRLIAQAYLSDYSEELEVDHIDRDRSNNKVSNLRMVTHQENNYNQGAKGYSWHKQRGKWQAQICVDGKRTHLGMFTCPVVARVAYLDAKRLLHTLTYDAGASSSSHKNGQ